MAEQAAQKALALGNGLLEYRSTTVTKLLCQNKVAYATPALAIARLMVRQRIERARLYAYKCQACDAFHLTKLKPPPDVIVTLKSKTWRGS